MVESKSFHYFYLDWDKNVDVGQKCSSILLRRMRMENYTNLLQQIAPEAIELIQRRYAILKGIKESEIIGRRTLAIQLNISERVLRTDIQFFKNKQILNVLPYGMQITSKGEELLIELGKVVHTLTGLKDIELQLNRVFHNTKIVISSGNADVNPSSKQEIGKAAALELGQHIRNNSIVAITGGSTVAKVIDEYYTFGEYHNNVLVVPARGGIGNRLEYQGNILASELANKMGASYKLLNIPDTMSKKAMKSVTKEPEIQQALDYISKADILVFGIGNAMEMARRRNLSETVRGYLHRKGAVAEAFGYYFNENGEVVYTSSTIGVKLELMKKFPYTLAVAGGACKAKAILAVRKYLENGALFLDEGAAHEILNLVDH